MQYKLLSRIQPGGEVTQEEEEGVCNYISPQRRKPAVRTLEEGSHSMMYSILKSAVVAFLICLPLHHVEGNVAFITLLLLIVEHFMLFLN